MTRALPLAIATAAFAAPAAAAERPDRHRFELGGGAVWSAGRSAGTSTATLTENPSGNRYTLFSASTDVGSAAGVSARAAGRLFGPLVIEGALHHTTPDIETRISVDVEGGSGTLTGSLSQTIVEGSLRLEIDRLALFRRRTMPYVFAGAGYLRETQQSFRQTGHTFHLGAGIQQRLLTWASGPVRGLGVRADGRVTWQSGGLDYADARRAVGRGALSLYILR